MTKPNLKNPKPNLRCQRPSAAASQLIYQTFPGQIEPTHLFPKDLAFVHCQAEACVLHKRKGIANLPYADEPGAEINQY